MAFQPVSQPPPVASEGFLRWCAQFWRDSTSRKRFTPVLTCATPGTLSVAYSNQFGEIAGNANGSVTASYMLVCTPTIGTASGSIQITGLPFTAASDVAGMQWCGSLVFQGITKSGGTAYNQYNTRIIGGRNYLDIAASQSGQTALTLAAADIPTGGSVILIGSVQFRI